MSRPRKLPAGTALHNAGDELTAIVVESRDTPAEWALVEAVTGYHGGPASIDNSVIREVAQLVRIRKWFYCSMAWREFEGRGDISEHPGDRAATVEPAPRNENYAEPHTQGEQ